ncbi:metallophosphoesterase family protein [Siculibacillus lacustris]|nr:metallophosphoesterase [Siculibacillus lacustris]
MFRLAHVSDPHLGPMPRPKLRELVGKRVLGYINWRLNRGRGSLRPAVLDELVDDLHDLAPDHVAVTGDIVNIALDAELEPARRWLDSLGAPRDVSVVPGNHDAYVRGALKRATDSWGPFLRGDTGESGRFPYVRRRGPVALIGVSSAETTAPFMATGRVGPGQALRLAEILDHTAHEGLYRVVLIHHPPARQPVHWAGRLIGTQAIRDLFLHHGAELILHGHTHRSTVEWLDGPTRPIPLVGVPSASRNPGPDRRGAGWNLFEIDGAPGAWHTTRIERGFRDAESGLVEIARAPLVP